jgi:hypothetical protein
MNYLAIQLSTGNIYQISADSTEEAYWLFGKQVLGMTDDLDTGNVDIDLYPLLPANPNTVTPIVVLLASASAKADARQIDTSGDLRKQILHDIDATLDAPWLVQRFISTESKRLLHALHNFWQVGNDDSLAKLLDLYRREP